MVDPKDYQKLTSEISAGAFLFITLAILFLTGAGLALLVNFVDKSMR